MTARHILLAGASAVALVLAAAPANAVVVTTSVNRVLSGVPVAITLPGAATLSFTSASNFFGPGAAVATGGTARVASFGGVPDDVSSGAIIDGALSYLAFTTPTAIPFSVFEDYIGLSFQLADGVHYGFAEVNGPSLLGFGYETVANTAITTTAFGATPTTPVPEPVSAALLVGSLAATGVFRRRRDPA